MLLNPPGSTCLSVATDEAAAAGQDTFLAPQDGFCSLVGDNLGQHSQALNDWRLQLLELLPAAQVQLTEEQVRPAPP